MVMHCYVGMDNIIFVCRIPMQSALTTKLLLSDVAILQAYMLQYSQ